jgi:hypothetical protein
MIGQFDFSEKGWVSGKGRSAVWREIPWEDKRIEPQFLMREEDFGSVAPGVDGRGRAGFMDVTSATNRRTMIAALIPAFPCGNKVPILSTSASATALVAALCSTVFDWELRQRLGGVTLNYFIAEETCLPTPASTTRAAEMVARRLAAAGDAMLGEFRGIATSHKSVRRLWAITPHERLRLRAMLDAIVAVLYGLHRADFAWILKDCDHPVERLSDRAFARQLDPKGFWRVDKGEDPELRHTVLSLVAFDDLQAAIARAGDRDAGIQAFCDQHDGDGWMLPEAVCLADLRLTRTVDPGEYDARAQAPQAVRARLGPRFLDWQLAQSVEASWAECERHAKAILGGGPAPLAVDPPAPSAPATLPRQTSLFDRS